MSRVEFQQHLNEEFRLEYIKCVLTLKEHNK